ncbi:MAG: sodium:solute symporter family transporter [Planctomycetota bacterium]|jgi:uncharacterized sodium:solute symporter family permease YidK
MELSAFDVIVFVGFFAVVIGVSLFKSRKESSSEDYFLAGRGLTWWLIGISIVAANISTEQFVGGLLVFQSWPRTSPPSSLSAWPVRVPEAWGWPSVTGSFAAAWGLSLLHSRCFRYS